jgi:hypothetical protein
MRIYVASSWRNEQQPTVREPWHMNGMDCNYRITVEAVPVESDK